MKHVKPYLFLSRILLVSVFALTWSFPAFSQHGNETQGVALKKEMYDMEMKAFSDYYVQPEAQRQMEELIDRAVETYNQKPNQEAHNRIIENFQNLLNTTASFRESYMKPHEPGMIMMLSFFAKSGQISLKSIEKALKKLCPIWPFC
jgi:hypothetical protein